MPEPTTPSPPTWRCETCRWWREDADQDWREYHECQRIDDGNADELARIETIGTRDDHIQPPLLTKAIFGCVLWEGRMDG